MSDSKPPTPAAPAPASGGDDLRDARLLRALAHMPDAHMQPGPHLRQAVLQQALRAVAPKVAPAGSGWWARLRAGWRSSEERVPWSAALASVAVVGLITVLWHGHEVPDANPEHTQVAQRTPDAAPAAVADMASRPAEAAAPAAPAAPADPALSAEAARSANEVAGETAPRVATAPRNDATSKASAAVKADAPEKAQALTHSEASVGRVAEQAGSADIANARGAAQPVARAPEGVHEGAARQDAARVRASETVAAGVAHPAPALVLGEAAHAPRRQIDAKLAASGAPQPLILAVNGEARQTDSEPVRLGLALLRSLRYVESTSPATHAFSQRVAPAPQGATLAKREAVPAVGAGAAAPAEAPWVVEIVGVERWTVTPRQVVHQRLDSGHRTQAAITQGQYDALRRMAPAPPAR